VRKDLLTLVDECLVRAHSGFPHKSGGHIVDMTCIEHSFTSLLNSYNSSLILVRADIDVFTVCGPGVCATWGAASDPIDLVT